MDTESKKQTDFSKQIVFHQLHFSGRAKSSALRVSDKGNWTFGHIE